MRKIFILSSNQYDAISFRSKYLYQDFNAVRSMLRSLNLPQQDINQLLEPKLNGSDIEWYGEFNGEFERLSNLDENQVNRIKNQFKIFQEKTEQLIETLLSKRDPDSQEWGKYFKQLFNPESIILLGNKNSEEWVMLWGFKFNTGNENIIPGGSDIEFIKENNSNIVDVGRIDEPIIKNEGEGDDLKKEMEIEKDKDKEKKEENDINLVPVSKPSTNNKSSIGFWGWIKRWLRWISYRFWGLFWLIIYSLLLIWLCRYCNKPNCDEYCKEMKKTKKELERLEERVRERCDTTYARGK